MNKKGIFVLIFVFLVSFFPLFASETTDFFINLKSRECLPVDSEIGAVNLPNTTENHRILSQALESVFDFEWTEKWLYPSMKESLSKVFSPVLSSILPAEGYLMSFAKTNSDSSVSINVKFKDGSIICFTLKDGSIIGLK